MSPLTVALFGISGSGKGTQTKLLAEALQARDERPVLEAEMGQLLREYFTSQTPLARVSESFVNGGGLLPTFVPIYVLVKFLDARFHGHEHLVLDGVCRRPEQSKNVDDLMRFYDRQHCIGIVIDLSDESALARIKGRGRSDDKTEETMLKRLAWYKEMVVPSIAILEQMGWEIHHVDGEPDIDTVHRSILSALKMI